MSLTAKTVTGNVVVVVSLDFSAVIALVHRTAKITSQIKPRLRHIVKQLRSVFTLFHQDDTIFQKSPEPPWLIRLEPKITDILQKPGSFFQRYQRNQLHDFAFLVSGDGAAVRKADSAKTISEKGDFQAIVKTKIT